MALEESFTQLGATVKALGFSFGLLLAPPVQKLADRLLHFIAVNRVLIGQKLGEWADRVSSGLERFGTWISVIGPKISDFVEKNGGLEAVLRKVAIGFIALQAVKLASLALAVLQLGKAFAVLSFALTTTPLGIVITALGLLTVGAFELYQNLGQVAGAVNRAMDAFKRIPQRGMGVVALAPGDPGSRAVTGGRKGYGVGEAGRAAGVAIGGLLRIKIDTTTGNATVEEARPDSPTVVPWQISTGPALVPGS